MKWIRSEVTVSGWDKMLRLKSCRESETLHNPRNLVNVSD